MSTACQNPDCHDEGCPDISNQDLFMTNSHTNIMSHILKSSFVFDHDSRAILHYSQPLNFRTHAREKTLPQAYRYSVRQTVYLHVKTQRVFQQRDPFVDCRMSWSGGIPEKTGSWPARLVPRKTSAPQTRRTAAHFDLHLLLRSVSRGRGHFQQNHKPGCGDQRSAAVCTLEAGPLGWPWLQLQLQGVRAEQQGTEVWEGVF